MKTESKESISPVPDGTYQGTWGGYTVRIKLGSTSEIRFQTKRGIRCPKAAVTVTVENGHASVETLA